MLESPINSWSPRPSKRLQIPTNHQPYVKSSIDIQIQYTINSNPRLNKETSSKKIDPNRSAYTPSSNLAIKSTTMSGSTSTTTGIHAESQCLPFAPSHFLHLCPPETKYDPQPDPDLDPLPEPICRRRILESIFGQFKFFDQRSKAHSDSDAESDADSDPKHWIYDVYRKFPDHYHQFKEYTSPHPLPYTPHDVGVDMELAQRVSSILMFSVLVGGMVVLWRRLK